MALDKRRKTWRISTSRAVLNPYRGLCRSRGMSPPRAGARRRAARLGGASR